MTSNNVPRHIAIIMDGNGRWAQNHHISKIAGHKKGKETLTKIVEYCAKIGVKFLTVFAFSSENINRPQHEVSDLFTLFLNALQSETRQLKANNIRLNIIGDLSIFDNKTKKYAKQSIQKLVKCNKMVLNIALNYGGRWDLVQATKKIANQIQAGKLTTDAIDEDLISKHLSLANQRPVDLMIRTSGEIRISNFLLWNIAYSELFFTPTLWPDFNKEELAKIINQYQMRHRRFGK